MGPNQPCCRHAGKVTGKKSGVRLVCFSEKVSARTTRKDQLAISFDQLDARLHDGEATGTTTPAEPLHREVIPVGSANTNRGVREGDFVVLLKPSDVI